VARFDDGVFAFAGVGETMDRAIAGVFWIML